jgi:hypothetical protein
MKASTAEYDGSRFICRACSTVVGEVDDDSMVESGEEDCSRFTEGEPSVSCSVFWKSSSMDRRGVDSRVYDMVRRFM